MKIALIGVGVLYVVYILFMILALYSLVAVMLVTPSIVCGLGILVESGIMGFMAYCANDLLRELRYQKRIKK